MLQNRMILTVMTCAAAAGGCSMAGKPGEPSGQALTPEALHAKAIKDAEPNVLRVVAYYQPPYRWMWTEDKTRVRGLVIGALYLEGPKRKGVFGDGNIQAKLYMRERDPSKTEDTYKLLREWSFTPEETLPLRTKHPTIQGSGYMLPLNWEDLNMNLGGQEVRVVIGYERTDGLHVQASSKDLIVPDRGS